MSYQILEYDDFNKKGREEIDNQLDFANECQYIDVDFADDYFVDEFINIYGIPDNVTFYLDDEMIAQDMAKNYTSVDVGDSSYYVID